jgi:hypothetical protein
MVRAVLKLCRAVGIMGRSEVFDSRNVKTKVVFMASQGCFTAVCMTPVPILYWYKEAHLMFIVILVVTSLFNGASFYVEVFSKRYNQRIEEIEDLHRAAQEAKAEIDHLIKEQQELENSEADGMLDNDFSFLSLPKALPYP